MHHQMRDEIYIFSEGVLGEVMSLGAHASQVRYSIGGVQFEVYIENDDFVILNEDKDNEVY